MQDSTDSSREAGSELSGYLWKLGEKGIRKNFKRRWFECRDMRLYYFQDKGDAEPIDFIPLDRVTQVTRDGEEMFHVHTRERVYSLAVKDDGESVTEWVSKVRSMCRRASQRRSTITDLQVRLSSSASISGNAPAIEESDDPRNHIISGYALKMGDFRRFQRRFFRLEGPVLSWYKDEQRDISEPQNSLNVSDIRRITVPSDGKTLVLELDARRYILQCDSAADRDMWHHAIRNARLRPQTSRGEKPVFDGADEERHTVFFGAKEEGKQGNASCVLAVYVASNRLAVVSQGVASDVCSTLDIITVDRASSPSKSVTIRWKQCRSGVTFTLQTAGECDHFTSLVRSLSGTDAAFGGDSEEQADQNGDSGTEDAASSEGERRGSRGRDGSGEALEVERQLNLLRNVMSLGRTACVRCCETGNTGDGRGGSAARWLVLCENRLYVYTKALNLIPRYVIALLIDTAEREEKNGSLRPALGRSKSSMQIAESALETSNLCVSLEQRGNTLVVDTEHRKHSFVFAEDDECREWLHAIRQLPLVPSHAWADVAKLWIRRSEARAKEVLQYTDWMHEGVDVENSEHLDMLVRVHGILTGRRSRDGSGRPDSCPWVELGIGTGELHECFAGMGTAGLRDLYKFSTQSPGRSKSVFLASRENERNFPFIKVAVATSKAVADLVKIGRLSYSELTEYDAIQQARLRACEPVIAAFIQLTDGSDAIPMLYERCFDYFVESWVLQGVRFASYEDAHAAAVEKLQAFLNDKIRKMALDFRRGSADVSSK